MLLRFLAGRRAPAEARDDADDPFRWRGEGVSRVEGLSDTVFGFAITLLVVSLDVPKTSDDLVALMGGVAPFVASFGVLFGLWRAQFEFFRRYGLEDQTTIRLTGLLLIGVLFSVYPVKFLFTFVLLVVPTALLHGHPDELNRVMRLESLPKVLALYGAGFLWVSLTFSMLYAHARRQRISLVLTPLEAFDTEATERRWRGRAYLGAVIVVWCVVVLAAGGHAQLRDRVFWRIWYGGLGVFLAASLRQRVMNRMTARARLRLTQQRSAHPLVAPAAAKT